MLDSTANVFGILGSMATIYGLYLAVRYPNGKFRKSAAYVIHRGHSVTKNFADAIVTKHTNVLICIPIALILAVTLPQFYIWISLATLALGYRSLRNPQKKFYLLISGVFVIAIGYVGVYLSDFRFVQDFWPVYESRDWRFLELSRIFGY